jgi:hypothetical protein
MPLLCVRLCSTRCMHILHAHPLVPNVLGPALCLNLPPCARLLTVLHVPHMLHAHPLLCSLWLPWSCSVPEAASPCPPANGGVLRPVHTRRWQSDSVAESAGMYVHVHTSVHCLACLHCTPCIPRAWQVHTCVACVLVYACLHARVCCLSTCECKSQPGGLICS